MMATRSRTRASTKAASSKNAKHSAGKEKVILTPPDRQHEDKEDVKIESTKSGSKRGKGKATATSKEIYCTCSRGDDGSPMIYCAECKKWHHFTCVELSEREAEDVRLFICPSCSEATGLHSIMSWDGFDAFDGAPLPKPQFRARSRTKTPVLPKVIPSDDESDGSNGSEDEYVGEKDEDEHHPKDRGKVLRKRRAVVSTSGSESDSFRDSAHRKRTRRLTKSSASPGPSRQFDNKRKASTSDARQTSKKQKAESVVPTDDPTRKYCLGKLEELFRDIFFRYPHVRISEDEGPPPPSQIVSKSLDDMSEVEKEALLERSKSFSAELEKRIFEGYADLDKAGNPSPGINYKDRFRTLQFNLSKPDRVFIHRRIASSNISADELSGMSSTDLANEETQQEIKQAEQEALEHSILQKVVAPRAKITHKGLQDIEYHDEPTPVPAPSNDVQRRKEAEAEERRERERYARLKPVQRQRTMSLSVAPESPVVPTTPTADSWGAPPPVPQSHREGQSPSSQYTAIPLSIRTGSIQRYTPEPELNLADLINIEEVSPSSEVGPTSSATGSTASGEQAADMDTFSHSTASSATEFHPTSSPTTAMSPFSIPPSQQSFSLSTLWNNYSKGPQDEEDASPGGRVSTTPPPLSPPTMKDDAFEDDDAMVESPIEQGDDQDFDMFIQDKESAPEAAPEAPAPLPSVENLPEVWKGMVSMPLDSSIPQETPMVARQIAGTPLQADSQLWKTLFPSDHLRIDGRVAVDSSAKYLMQMRLSSAKELYAVALSPASEADEATFKSLNDFLTAKGRHGLVFPWGSRPKDHHPGRELYMIPLGASEPLPEYVEMLDNLQLTKDRKRNYMIAIWILNKGKLLPPPPPPAPHTTPFQPMLANPLQAVPLSQTPPAVPTYTPPIQNPVHGASALGMLASLGPKPYAPLAAPAPAIDPTALAAEVASLTPEQIQGVLRTLQMSGTTLQSLLPGHAPAVPPASIPPAYPPYIPPVHTGHSPQPWQAAAPSYPPGYPPYSGPPQSPHQGSHLSRSEDRYERNNQGDRDGQGWRGRGRGGRARGRGGGGDGLPVPGRPADSGWPRKAGKNSPKSYDSDRRW